MSRKSLKPLFTALLLCALPLAAFGADKPSAEEIQRWVNTGNNAFYGTFAQEADYGKAFTAFQKAAKYDDPEALYMLGTLYYDGKGVQKDTKKGLELYVKAAEAGQPDAQMIVANQHMYLAMRYPPDSALREQEYAKAAALFKKAAAQQQPEALLWYGDLQIKGLGGLKQDEEKGLASVRKAAELHNANAHATLATYYMDGKPLVKDFGKAYMHLLISRDEGNKNAIFGLKMLEQGLSKDEITAAEKAAAQWQKAHPKPKSPLNR